MRMREQAICLQATDYSETSQVLGFLTRQAGAVRVIGKGTKRPKSKSAGPIDLLCEGELIYSTGRGQSLATLIEFTETDAHRDLRTDRRRLNAGLYALEIVNASVHEGDVHAEVFDLLHNTLTRLGQTDAPVAAVLAYFQWRLLRHMGLLGQLHTCVTCGGEKGSRSLFFSSALGGVVCERCSHTAPDKTPVDAETLAGLLAVAAAESGRFDKLRTSRRTALPGPAAAKVNRLLCYHISHQLGHRPKMARHAMG